MNEKNAFVHRFEKEQKEIDDRMNELNRQKQEIEKGISKQIREKEKWEEKTNRDFQAYMQTCMQGLYQVTKALYWGRDEQLGIKLIHDTHEMYVKVSVKREQNEFCEYHVLFTVCLKPDETTKSIPYAELKEILKDFLQTELEKHPETRLIALTTEKWATVQAKMVQWI